MKLAHIPDTHLGIRQYHRQTSSGINQREADVAQAFRTTIDGVIGAQPDLVVFAEPAPFIAPHQCGHCFCVPPASAPTRCPADPLVLIAAIMIRHGQSKRARSSIVRGAGCRRRCRSGSAPGVSASRSELACGPRQVMRAAQRPVLQPEGPEKYRCWLYIPRWRASIQPAVGGRNMAAQSSAETSYTSTNGAMSRSDTTIPSTR